MHRILPVFLIAAAIAAPAPAAADGITPEMDRWLMASLDRIYEMRFDEAEEAARKAIALNPEHPHGHFSLAGAMWTRYVYGTDQGDERLIAPFEAQAAKTVAVAQRWLKKHPRDPEALTAMGAAYGIAGRLAVARQEWLKAYWIGRKAVGITRQAVKADSNFYDAYLGLGMYDYYTDVYPRFIGVLAKIVLRGNRQRGIETLEMVAEKGHYSRNNAKIVLVEIYTSDSFGAKNPQRALALMRDLRAQYPDSAMLHAAEVVALYEAKRYREAEISGQRYLALSREGRYGILDLAKSAVILGCVLWAQGKSSEALAAFREASSVRWRGGWCRWALWGAIRAGQLQDFLGRRGEAKRDYGTAAGVKDRWGLRALAKQYLSRPYAAPDPGSVSPP